MSFDEKYRVQHYATNDPEQGMFKDWTKAQIVVYRDFEVLPDNDYAALQAEIVLEAGIPEWYPLDAAATSWLAEAEAKALGAQIRNDMGMARAANTPNPGGLRPTSLAPPGKAFARSTTRRIWGHPKQG